LNFLFNGCIQTRTPYCWTSYLCAIFSRRERWQLSLCSPTMASGKSLARFRVCRQHQPRWRYALNKRRGTRVSLVVKWSKPNALLPDQPIGWVLKTLLSYLIIAGSAIAFALLLATATRFHRDIFMVVEVGLLAVLGLALVVALVVALGVVFEKVKEIFYSSYNYISRD